MIEVVISLQIITIIAVALILFLLWQPTKEPTRKDVVRIVPDIEFKEVLKSASNRVIPLTDEYEYEQGKKFKNNANS
jgi:hypothetical protein